MALVRIAPPLPHDLAALGALSGAASCISGLHAASPASLPTAWTRIRLSPKEPTDRQAPERRVRAQRRLDPPKHLAQARQQLVRTRQLHPGPCELASDPLALGPQA